jgi:hypothetical protein
MSDARRAAGNGTLLPPEPRRRKASGTLLPPEQRVEKAATILANAMPEGRLGVCHANIEAELFWLRGACAGVARVRLRYSKQAMHAMRTFLAALRKANRPCDGLPEDLRLLFALDCMIYHLEAYEKFLNTNIEVKKVEKVGKDADRLPAFELIPRRRTPRPEAFEKSLATQAALRLCQLHKIALSKGRTLRELAAALYGDPNADLEKHCRAALKRL